MHVDWENVFKYVDEALRFFESQGVKPTLRALFYRLVSYGVLPNTKNYYKQLSRRMVEARKKGLYSWDCIDDRVRYVEGVLCDWKPDEEQVEEIKKILAKKLEEFNLDAVLESYFRTLPTDFEVGKWADQPYGCLVLMEKDALMPTVQKWLEGWDVPIGFCKGYDSWTDLYRNSLRIKKMLLRGHRKVLVIYLGDLDPTGVDIDRHMKEAFSYFGLGENEIEFRRVAVTQEQVEKYNLPPRPEDVKTLEKLKRDTRSKKYTGKYIVELDAFLAYTPNEFKRIVVDAVSSVWNKDIYEVLKLEAQKLKNEVEEAIKQTIAEAKKKCVSQ
jgi:hypothetical protein